MSKKKRFISLLLAFMLICSFSITALADGLKVGSSGGSGQGGGSRGGTGTITMKNGCSYKKTGFTFYICSKDGSIVKEPKSLVTYPDMSPVGKQCLDTRFGNRRPSISSGSMHSIYNWWCLPPFESDGSGNGGKIKNWLLQETPNGSINALEFINEVWDFQTAVNFINEDQYLMIESFSWSGIYSGSSYVGDVVGSSLGWVRARESLGLSKSGNETRYSLGILPNSICFDIPVLGVPAAHDIFEKHNYDEIKASGFGIVSCWAGEITNKEPVPDPVITPPTTDDYLKANELNYVFPDFKPDSDDMRQKDTYTEKYNMTPESVWKKHPDGDGMEDGVKYTFSDDKIYEGKWYIIETITSSIKTKIGLTNALLYRSGAGLYFASNNAENLKTINCGENGTADSQDRYPGYGYDLTRTTFGDNIVISEFSTRGDNQSMKNHFKDELKFAVGHDGVKSNISMTDNVEGKANNSLSDTHSFDAKITEYYKRKPWTWVEATYKKDANGNTTTEVDVPAHWDPPAADAQWEEKTKEYKQSGISYPVNHGLFKYTPYDIKTAETGKAGTILHAPSGMSGSYPKVIWASQLMSVLKIYPEVKYEGYYVSGGGVWSDPAKKDIYVMGEKKRSCKPGVVHGYITSIPGGVMKGKTYVDAPLTGTNADELADTWETKKPDNPYQTEYEVCAQGSGFETRTLTMPEIKLVTFGLDLRDESINGFNPKSTWESGSIEGSHAAFVNNVIGNVDMTVTMKRYNLSDAQIGEDYDMSFDAAKTKINTEESKQIKILFENGAIDATDKAKVISEIASAYGVDTGTAAAIFNGSGIEQEIKDMLETKLSAKNKSGTGLPADIKHKTTAKWYDETSECFAITFQTSTVYYGNILLSDKHDYGSSADQSKTDITSVGKTGYICKYFFNMFHVNDSINPDGFNLPTGGVKYLIKDAEIHGSRFIVSNATTNNMRR